MSVRRRVLDPHLGDDRERRATARRISAALASGPSRPRPSLTSTRGTRIAAAHSRHSAARSCSAAISSSVPPGQAATSCRRSSVELGVELRVEVGAAPAELPEVEEAGGGVRGWRAPRRRGRPPSSARGQPDRRGLPGAARVRTSASCSPTGSPTIVRSIEDRSLDGAGMTGADLAAIVAAVRSSPGWRSKSHIAVVGDVFGAPDWLRGPGRRRRGRAGGRRAHGGRAARPSCPPFVERDPLRRRRRRGADQRQRRGRHGRRPAGDRRHAGRRRGRPCRDGARRHALRRRRCTTSRSSAAT